MKLAVHQPQYLPWLGYFDKIARCDLFVFLDLVQYKEREFQNRNKIRTAQGALWLTVPVLSAGKGRQGIREVRIDNSRDWKHQHLRTLESAYTPAPYFSVHREFFRDTYSREWESLVDLNIHVISYLLRAFGITTRCVKESEIGTSSMKTDRIIELCRKTGATEYLSGAGGKEYLEEDKFPASGITLSYQHYGHPRYRQQFTEREEDFLAYLSAVDILCNEGPEAGRIITTHAGGNT